jgi:UDP-N-acetylglucosamine 2-epimerase (non-hydrolysing)
VILNAVFYKPLSKVLDERAEYIRQTESGAKEQLAKTEALMKAEKPDAVVILGDTNSGLAGIMAKRLKIPFFHLEAGNRCYDDNVPEEINRRMLDHIADVNMVYTANQRLNLIGEGLLKDRIFIMGSPMKEVFTRYKDKITSSDIRLRLGLVPGDMMSAEHPYYLVSIHRDENTEIESNLTVLVDTLNHLANSGKKVVVTTHPRFRKKLEGMVLDDRIMFMKPFGFFDYVHLQMHAECVLSDSGTISEESSLLGFPAVTIRNAIERTEAMDVGSILMTGVDEKNILDCIKIAEELKPRTIPFDYDVDNCSERVLKMILGFTGFVNRNVWHK